MADSLSARTGREFVLTRVERSRHVEPFRFSGATFGARVPTMMQVEIARGAQGASNKALFLASLAVQCTEVKGELVFVPSDVPLLLHDELYGFLDAFRGAIAPFLSPPVLPKAMVRHG